MKLELMQNFDGASTFVFTARRHKSGTRADRQTKTEFANSAFVNSAFDYGNSTFDLKCQVTILKNGYMCFSPFSCHGGSCSVV
jgi:hypothetical protein